MALANTGCNSVRWAFNFASWTPTESQLLVATSCIQAEEKERIGRFVFQKDAKASLIGRLLMRKFASNFLDSYSKVQFGRDQKGKPYLINGQCNSNISFNVSHQGNYTVLAGETDKSVGIDVMKIEYSGGKSLSEFFRLMTRHFSSEEWVNIKGYYGTPEREKLAMFCRHWCLKESYVKATGTGITVDLQDISFRVLTRNLSTNSVVNTTRVYIKGKEQHDWHFEESLLDREHCVAVAWKKLSENCFENEKTFQFLNFDGVMENCEPILPIDPTYCQHFLNKEVRPS